MLLLSRGLLVSFSELLNAEGFDLRIVASSGFTRVPIPDSAALADAVRQLPGVADVAAVRVESAEVVSGKSRTRVALIGRDQARGRTWRL
ncbi:MAG TPA: hypothetical protein VFF43_13745, partial [Caldimonas sp.]|nr:hypothetical protein [Caldimonas sp.]